MGDRVSAVKDTTLFIHCPFKGFPYPRVTWFRNGKVIDHVKYENIDILEPDGLSKLRIVKLDKEHEGSYRCVAFNVYGRKQATAQVRQIGKFVIT